MMKKLILVGALLCAFGALSSCKSAGDTVPEATPEAAYYWNGDKFSCLTDKVCDGDMLDDEEWKFLLYNIEHADGYYAEGIGYALYKNLKDNVWYNDQMAATLHTLPYEQQEQTLRCLLVCMSIDLISDEEHYSWLQFVEKFPVFIGYNDLAVVLEEIYEDEL